MKKQLLLLAMILLPMVVSAYDVCIDGIYYNIVSKAKTAEVTFGENKYQGEITIPSEFEYDGSTYMVTGIGNDAFKDCQDMTKIELPPSITILGDQAFYGCRFSKITIPQNVESIGKYCFLGNRFKSITIPASVNTLKTSVFKSCVYLKDVHIDGYIENIDDNVFLYCEALTAVHILDIAKWCKNSFYDGWSNPLYYAKHLYINNEEITDLVIPNSVEELGMQVFVYCTGFKSVVIPSTIKSIRSGAFWGCSGIESLEISDGVETIENGAFGACSGLKSVYIPNSVTCIQGFSNCTGLTTIYIGNNVSRIMNNAFSYCKNLSDFYCYSEKVPETASDAFQESYIEYSTLHVPEISVELYKNAEPWKSFQSIIGLDGTIPEVQKCQTPVISYNNGKLSFSSETEGVEFISEITDVDVKKYYDAEIALSATYNINVYATKRGYDNSDVATATLCWIDKEPTTEGIANGVAQIPSKAVLIQNEGGILTIQGADEGTQISIYAVDGTQKGASVSKNGAATINTSLQSGSVAIIKIGEKSVKVIVK